MLSGYIKKSKQNVSVVQNLMLKKKNMPDIKTKSRNSSKVNSRNYSSGPLKSANRAKFRNVSAEETGTTGSPTAENENHQPDNNNQHNGKSFFYIL